MFPLRNSEHALRTNIQKPASQHTFQQVNLANQIPNSKNQQTNKPIRILRSQRTTMQPAAKGLVAGSEATEIS